MQLTAHFSRPILSARITVLCQSAPRHLRSKPGQCAPQRIAWFFPPIAPDLPRDAWLSGPFEIGKKSCRGGDKATNQRKLVLGIGVAVAILALSLTAFATLHVALLPTSATLDIAGPTTSKTFDAFCSFTPCNITWVIVLSNANVGSIDNTSGPQTTFTVGTVPGTAYIFASDGNGHMAQAKVDVQ